VSDFRGAEPGLDAAQTLATNALIHQQLLAAIGPLLPADG
jgi:hypothetical protein